MKRKEWIIIEKSEQLQDCLSQLEEIAKTTEGMAITNEERASSITLLLEHSKVTQKDIKGLDSILLEVGKMSNNLHMLAINMAIESAHINTPTVDVIATKMRKMSKQYTEHIKVLQKLSDDIKDKTNELVSKLEISSVEVLDTSAGLEELTACTEELVATLEDVIK